MMRRPQNRFSFFIPTIVFFSAVFAAAPLFAVGSPHGAPEWRTLSEGMSFALVEANLFTKSGSNEIAVLRIDPKRCRFELFHYSEENARKPADIGEWLDKTGAIAVFNAGQYYPDRSYLGLFIKNGRNLGGEKHKLYKALFAAEPITKEKPRARIFDLKYDAFDPGKSDYRQVAQSFMLLDRNGRKRVRNSGKIARRTAVSVDDEGRIVVWTSLGEYTLWDFAEILLRSPLGIREAMSMDGGNEACLAVGAAGIAFDANSRRKGKTNKVRKGAALPAVIAVFDR